MTRNISRMRSFTLSKHKLPESFVVKTKIIRRRDIYSDTILIEELFQHWKAISWSIECSSGVGEGKHDVGNQGLVEVGQQFQDAKLESHCQPWVVRLEKHNHGVDLVIASKKGQDFIEVFLVLLNASAVPDARCVNKMEDCGAGLQSVLLRELGGRLTTRENFIIISRPKGDVHLFSIFIRENKPNIIMKYLTIIP